MSNAAETLKSCDTVSHGRPTTRAPVDPSEPPSLRPPTRSNDKPCCELNSSEAVAKPWAGAGAVSECDSSCGLVFCPVRLLEMPPEQGFYG